ncbi:MAG: Type 1 glutamine amidotransferase-like domain-containing protein [bacterium]|nr:Type 1 glutamine amidotransferase-like domain-containing protein [bacterium]
MNYNIFLSGGGNSQETYGLDDLFLHVAGSRILYVPVGLKRTFAGYDDCVTWFTDMVSKHNVEKKISVWIDLKEKSTSIRHGNFDAIYIGGASDTYRLHSLFKKNNFYPELEKFIKDGGIIYGGSGGATILGRSINYDQQEKQLPTTVELSANLCLGYSVFPHLSDNKFRLISTSPDAKVICMPEGSGVAIDTKNQQMKYLGKQNGIVISKKKTLAIKDGDLLKLDDSW